MRITDFLSPSCIRVPLVATEKNAVITELVDLLHENDLLINRDETLQAVLAREKTRSTGIGNGLAVPHGKSSGCRSLCMAIGKPATPLEFDSADGKPCDAVVLLASPFDETGPHIQALARVSRLWLREGFRNIVARCNDAASLYEAIKQNQE